MQLGVLLWFKIINFELKQVVGGRLQGGMSFDFVLAMSSTDWSGGGKEVG
ncbi:hypothetical protein [Geobacter sulfurreducens]|nr:hypothetical protein [Geobacter sulfurreducens]HML78851.1 hypothetical protein [Geobacter sulfurreducens]